MPTLTNSYVAEAERAGLQRPNEAEWLTRVRQAALARFDALGFPTTRDEEWRFTSVAPIAEGRFVIARDGADTEPIDRAPFEWDGPRAATLVFVDGGYAPAASDEGTLPEGVYVGSLARALVDRRPSVEAQLARLANADRHAFTALNTAFLADGACVFVPEATAIDAPIHLLFLSRGGAALPMAHPRVLAVMGARSQATIVETYGASRDGQYFTNAVTELVAGQESTLNHYKVQREHPAAFHIGAMYVRVARNAAVACHSVVLGGGLVRNEVDVVLDGEGATCTLNGLYLTDGTRLVDNHTTIDHARAHCASRELYKGVLADRSRAVFNGKIVVRPDAQKTDAKQTNKALLLSGDAQIHAKPQLEIFANDVKCTHGAAVGQIDEEAVFYLRARGIGEREARHLLVRAFASDVLNQMPLAELRARIDRDLLDRLPGAPAPSTAPGRAGSRAEGRRS